MHNCQLHFVKGPFSYRFLRRILPRLAGTIEFLKDSLVLCVRHMRTSIYLRTGSCHLGQLRISISPSEYDLPIFILVQYCRLCWAKVRATLLFNCHSYRIAIMRATLHTELHYELPDMIVTVPAFLV